MNNQLKICKICKTCICILQSYILINSIRRRQYIEAVVWRCSVKKVFLKISQNSQENTCARVSFLIKLYITSPVDPAMVKVKGAESL